MGIRTYHLCPDEHTPPPPEGPIHLGHIIANLNEPANPLNPSSRLSASIIVYKHTSGKTTATSQDTRDGDFGVWAQFLQLPKVGASANASSDTKDAYECHSVLTTFFNPTQEFFEQSVHIEGVQRFLKASRYKKPVYMVTGLKIAKGVKVTRSGGKGRGGSVEGGADLTSAGVPAQFGSEAHYQRTQEHLYSAETEEDIVIAFRVRKLTCKKSGTVSDKSHNEGAFMGVGDELKVKEELLVTADEDDAGAEQAEGSRVLSVVGGEGEEICQYVVYVKSE
jgi:hypothetical protein